MPELPEVETVRRGLAPILTRALIQSVDMSDKQLRFPWPRDFVARLEGRVVNAVDRRAKYLLLRLDSGETLVVHLGMSGRVSISDPGNANAQLPAGGAPPNSLTRSGPKNDGRSEIGALYFTNPPNREHDHVLIKILSGEGPTQIARQVVYNDPRRFGFMDIVNAQGQADYFSDARIGPEPLGDSLDIAALGASLAKKSAPIKTILLDQRMIAGLGNIYVCEALYRARIHPARASQDLNATELRRLIADIRDVLSEAIEAGGSSLQDYAQTDGSPGLFQHRFRVYDRAGHACAHCGTAITRITQSGRSTFLCANCQV